MSTAIDSKTRFSPAFIRLLSATLSVVVFGCTPLSAFQSQDAPRPSSSAIAIAKRELDAQHFAEAASALSRMLQADSHSGAEVYRLLAFAQFKQNDSDGALTTCESGLVIYPDSNSLADLYVSILRRTLSADDQRSHLEIAIRWAPDSPALLKALGEQLLVSNSQDPRAFQLLARAAKFAPNDAEAHFFYGESACFNQSDNLCIQELRRSHELAPSNQQANMQLFTMIAVSEDKQNQTRQAAADFALAMKANRTLTQPSPYAAMKYATFLSSQNKRAEAMDIVGEILRWDPTYGPAHFERAKYLSDQGKREEAITEAERALQYPKSSEEQLRSYHYFLARTYFALGRPKDAEIHESWIESHPQR